MPAPARLALFALLACLLQTPAAVAEPRATDRERIEEMVARCNGDRTCELVVRKRETAAAEKRQQRALLKQSDPVSYYLQLWMRYLAFVLAAGGGALLYVFLMRRMFGKKK